VINAIEDNIAIYQAICGVLPDDLSQVGNGGLLDPWAVRRKDRFLVPLNSDYDLYSMGKFRRSRPARFQWNEFRVFVASSTKMTPLLGTKVRPNKAPAPAGDPLLSRSTLAICSPKGVISIMKPSPPLTVKM